MVNPDSSTPLKTYPFVRKPIYQGPSDEEMSSFFHTIRKCPSKTSKSDLAGEKIRQVSTERSLQAFHAFVNKTISDFQLQSIPKLVNHQQSKRTNSIINIILKSPSSVTVSVDSFCKESDEDTTELTQPNGFRENPYPPLPSADKDNKSSAVFLSNKISNAENESFGLTKIKEEHESTSTFLQAREKTNQRVTKLIESVLAIPGNTERAINNKLQASKRAINNRIQMKISAVNLKVEEKRSLMNHRIEVARLRVIAFPNRLLTAAALELKAARGRFVHFIYITPLNAVNRKVEEGKLRVNHAIELKKNMILDAKDKRKKAITDKVKASKMAVYDAVESRKKAAEERINKEIQAIRKSLKEAVSLANIFKKKSHAECQSPSSLPTTSLSINQVPTRRLLHDFEHEKTLHVFEVNRKPSLCYQLDQVFDSIKLQMSNQHIANKFYRRERYPEAFSSYPFVLNKNGADFPEISGFQKAYQGICKKSMSEQVKDKIISTKKNLEEIKNNLNRAKEISVQREEAITNKGGGDQKSFFNSRRSTCRHIHNIPNRFYTDPKLPLDPFPKKSKNPKGTSSSPELESHYLECHPKSLQTRYSSDSAVWQLKKRPKGLVSSSRYQTKTIRTTGSVKAKVQVMRKKEEGLGVLKIVKHVLKKSMTEVIALARNTVIASNHKRSVERKRKNRQLLGYLKLLLQDLSSCVVNGLRCLTQTSSNFLKMIVYDQPEPCY